MIFPVMITLQEIRDHGPCRSGWAKVLDANGGVNADMSNQFELSSIIDSNSVVLPTPQEASSAALPE